MAKSFTDVGRLGMAHAFGALFQNHLMLFGMLYFGFGFELISIINLIYLFLVIQYIPFKVGTLFAFTSPIFVNYWGTVGLVSANGAGMSLRSIYSIHYASTTAYVLFHKQ